MASSSLGELVLGTDGETMGNDKEVLNADEVSSWLRIPKSTLYKLCSNGQIPCAKIGKHWRFDRAMLKSWFEKRVQGTI
ncbi:MAG: helix-turn-helix domain-containing protein [Thermodesulfobacteriota bacterium]